MKRIGIICVAIGAVLVALSLVSTARAQNRVSDIPWEYAYVAHGTYAADVVVQFIEDDGCRVEVIKVDPVRRSDRWSEIDWYATRGKAVAFAVRRLGADGWEMVGQGESYCGTYGDTAIHFKRARR